MSENKNGTYRQLCGTHFCCTVMHARGLRESRADIKYNNQYQLKPYPFGFAGAGHFRQTLSGTSPEGSRERLSCLV